MNIACRKVLIFIVGASLGWNLRRTNNNKKKAMNKSAGITTEQQQLRGGNQQPWYASILHSDVHIWNGLAPLGSAAKPCQLQDVTVGTTQVMKMCVVPPEHEGQTTMRPEEQIAACAHLPARLMHQGEGAQIFVDIGSSSGACVLTMLAQTKANIIAVEPHPIQLYHLTSTILKLDQALRDRVVVLPMAAGSRDDLAFMFTSERNYGGNVGKEFENESFEVAIHRLGTVLTTPTTPIVFALFNIDSHGMECDVLRGMKGLKIEKIYMASDEKKLKQFQCSRSSLLDLSKELGYQQSDEGGNQEGHVALTAAPI